MKIAVFLFLILFAVAEPHHTQGQNASLPGAWESVSADQHTLMICSDKFFSVAVYDVKNKTFAGTWGGSYRFENGSFITLHEFNTFTPESVGKEFESAMEFQKNKLVLREGNEKKEWKRIDDGTPGKLSGAWLITGRMQGDEIRTITPGARRTMKILSGTRFQWIAYNTETKEFFGTGGGTYTTQEGKYVENILFFSRDNSRVGASLSFDFALENGNWRHKGLSSKGDPIDEVWTKREKTGL